MNRCEHCDAPAGQPCPRWVSADWGLLEHNIQTGENRPAVGCFYPIALRFLTEVARASNSAAAAAESSRNVTLPVAQFMQAMLDHHNGQRVLRGPEN